MNSKQPDKELFDKAMIAMKKGRFDVARLDLQTMLNTYPDSEYRMRAKLAVGDSWFKEGGTAALTQAEAEYKDFITFFPDAPEAAEAQMKVADIYYQQMEKPDRDYTNAQRAEQEYRAMINMFPDSTLVPRAKQKLRDVQEVLAERETADRPLLWEPRELHGRDRPPRDRGRYLSALLQERPGAAGHRRRLCRPGPRHPDCAQPSRRHQGTAARRLSWTGPPQAYAKVITRYPMAPHVEDARDRLVAMNRPVPEPTQAAIAENDAEERSRQPLRFTDKTLDHQARAPVVEAVHVGEPSLDDPKRTLAPDITKQNIALFNDGDQRRQAAAAPAAAKPTGVNEPPRSDQPSQAPLQLEPPEGGTGVGVQIVSAPQPADPNAVVKAVGPTNTACPRLKSRPRLPNRSMRSSRVDANSIRRRRQQEEAQGRSERRIIEQEEEEKGTVEAEPVLERFHN